MASIACMFEECPNLATFTGTFLENGSSVTVCGDHFVDFAAGTLEGITGIPVTTLILLPPETFDEMKAAVTTLSDVPPTTPDESSAAGTESDHELTDDERNDLIRDGGGVVDDDDAHDLSRDSIADKLDEKHADVTDAEFHPAPTE